MINLLPQKEKETLRSEERKKIFLIFEILALVFFICLAFILTSVEIYISGRAEAEKIILEQEKKEFETSEIKDFSEKIKLANQTFSYLNYFYKNQVKSTEIFTEIYETIPEGIYLTSFSYQKNISSVSLFGFSKSREIILQFKKNLEQKGNFENIYFPPSTWIESKDITFNLNFKIKK